MACKTQLNFLGCLFPFRPHQSRHQGSNTIPCIASFIEYVVNSLGYWHFYSIFFSQQHSAFCCADAFCHFWRTRQNFIEIHAWEIHSRRDDFENDGLHR